MADECPVWRGDAWNADGGMVVRGSGNSVAEYCFLEAIIGV